MDVVLTLRDPRELFEQPARSPFDDDYEPWCSQPAAEYLAQVVRSSPRAPMTLEVPGADPARTREALARYCGARAGELAREIKSEIRHALWALVPAAAVFAATVLLSRLADSASSHWISGTVSEALVLIGWVVFWSPIAILGTDIWALRSRRRAYEALASHDLEIR